MVLGDGSVSDVLERAAKRAARTALMDSVGIEPDQSDLDPGRTGSGVSLKLII